MTTTEIVVVVVLALFFVAYLAMIPFVIRERTNQIIQGIPRKWKDKN